MMEVKKSVFDKYVEIIFFLNECQKNDWLLNAEDIRYVIKGDFNFVRKQYEAFQKC